jgi:serine/threonine protein kinase
VYLGQILSTRQSVAIKQVQELEENEIACLINTKSENIIKMYDFWTCNKQSYIVLELCERNLKQELEIQIKLKPDRSTLLNYFEQIVNGMDHLYQKGIIHRDLKF